MKYFILCCTIMIFFSGCGETSPKKIPDTPSTYKGRSINTSAKTSFGYLANATVNIYEVSEGNKILLFSEKTSTGNTLEQIGNFKAHLEDLHPKKFYQFEIKGGENWDADDDGIKDSTPTKNKITYRALYKGYKMHLSWWSIKNTHAGTSEQ
jgi:hypothetical protein